MISLFRLGNRRRCGFGEGWVKIVDRDRCCKTRIWLQWEHCIQDQVEGSWRWYDGDLKCLHALMEAEERQQQEKDVQERPSRLNVVDLGHMSTTACIAVEYTPHALFAAMVECQLQLSLNR